MNSAARPSGRTRSGPIVEGEFLFTTDDFLAIAAMLYDDAGIALTENKASLVYSRLAKRLRALGLENFRDYCRLVAGSEGLDERQNMLAALTTNVTKFFREPHHFEHLKTKVLPPLIRLAREGGRVRFWSAGCSTGQEPYSIALTILDAMPDASRHDVRILATDIDPNVVVAGRTGIYRDDLVQSVPAALRERWMERSSDSSGDGWAAGDEMRRLVSFRELNLMGHWPMKGTFHAIFCRNVVIYFDEATQTRIWSRFAPLLVQGGRLYVGHSERVSDLARFETDGLTAYRVRERA